MSQEKILQCLLLPHLSWFPRTEIASCEQKQVQAWDTGHNHKNLMFTAWFQCQLSFCSQNSDIISSGELTSSQLSSLPLHSRVVPSRMSQRENSSRITQSLETRPGTCWQSPGWASQMHARGWAVAGETPALTAAVLLLLVYSWPFRRQKSRRDCRAQQ